MILCGQGLKQTSICAAFLAMRAGYAIRRINLIWPNLCIIFRMNIGKYGVKFTTVGGGIHNGKAEDFDLQIRQKGGKEIFFITATQLLC